MKKIVMRKSDGEWQGGDLDPLLKKIYLGRGINSCDEIDYQLKNLFPFDQLKGIDDATELLWSVLQDQGQILIVGDFDVDGATSTVVALKALRAFGFENVDYLVPNRFEYGYGLSSDLVPVAARYNPDLIITVDNGISSIDGVETARKLGIKVLVTDHHLPGAELPNAGAIVNPNQKGDLFPSKNLAGVGVVFYLMLAFRKLLRDKGWFGENRLEPNLADFLDLVALGTIADIVTLDRNNRIFVKHGVERIRYGKCSAGIRALFHVTGRDISAISTGDLSYVLAPRLNAAGRLDDMSLGVECLLTDDYKKAIDMAQQLDILNDERKAIEHDMRIQAEKELNELQLDSDLPLGICLFDQNWHQGVVGILASRVKSKLNRPVVAFAKVDDNEIKGSARSIEGLHIKEVIEAVDAKHPELINKYGGHAMAAGIQLGIDKYEDFCKAFLDELDQHITEDHLYEKIWSDGELESEHFSLETANMLNNSGPWGCGFDEPVFSGRFSVLDQKLIGNKHLKLTLALPGHEQKIEAIMFFADTEKWPNYQCKSVSAAFKLDINKYRGRHNLQLVLAHLEPYL
ncbi:MAG: single-stranded-DNA-specific exonuclease RecJ [Gammaproteobacteria bacterium]|nr:single-stranded-DNA-specific exonuclease RecJ [Gammaproteobacteria bacterium]